MKIATWNVNSLNVRLPHVLEWLNKNKPDILCIQETKQTNDKFPHDEFESLNWFSYHNGQKTYNGVAIISNKPLVEIQNNIPLFKDDQSRLISGVYEKDFLRAFVSSFMAAMTNSGLDSNASSSAILASSSSCSFSSRSRSKAAKRRSCISKIA